MRRSRPTTPIVTAILVVLVLAGTGLWFGVRYGGTGVARQSSSSSGPSTSEPAQRRLTLALGRVQGKRISGRHVRRRSLEPAAEAVRRVMTELYSIGFVDANAWQEGSFPSIYSLFTRPTRARVRRDLDDLTLGPLAVRLDAVRPRPSVLGIRFLVAHNPIVAVASVHFRATALAGGASLPIDGEGQYTLRHVDGRWRIASFKVVTHLPSVQQVNEKVRRASGSPALASTHVFFVLVIGSDARPGQPPAATRADSIHIVGVNPARHAVSILGLPRDSFVPIPGVGTAKINSALVWGGPDLVVRTVERLTGVPIQGYVLTGFAGFQELVNAVGGITVDVPYRMSDPFSGAFFQPGPKHLTGREALQFSRDRHDVPGGDFGRSMNQGRMLIAALRQLELDVKRNPAALLPWISAGARVLRTDLSLSDMIGLLMSAPSLDPARVVNRVVSRTGAVVGGQDVIRLGSSAHATFRDFAADAIFNHRA